MKLNWLQRRIVKLAKAWEPRLSSSDITTPGWPAESGQDLEGNVKAVRYTTWAYICIAKIGRSIAGLPMNFYRGYGDNPEKLTDGDIPDLLHRPNPEDTHRELWLDTATFQLATGTSYWALDQFSEFNGAVVPGKSTIWTLPADRVKVVPAKGDPTKRISHYEILAADGTKIRYEPEEIVQFKSFNLENQYYGMAPLTVAMKTMEADFYAREHNRIFFKNGATVADVLESDSAYNEAADKRIHESWKKQQGYKNSHKLLTSWSGLKWKDTKRGPKDLDFLNLIKLNREEIIALFGVPPAVVGLFEYANYANANMQKREFWLETIIPMLLSFETRLNEMVFPRWTDQEIWMEFDLSGVPALQEDQLEKAKVNVMLVRARIKTPNEARAGYNMEPLEGGDEFPELPTFGAVGQASLRLKAYDNQTDNWYQKDIARRQHERIFLDKMKSYFAGQKSRVLKSLAGYPEDYAIDKINLRDIFNELKEQEILEKDTKHLTEDAVGDAGQAGIDEVAPRKSLNLGLTYGRMITRLKQDDPAITTEFDLTDPNVVAWIESKVARFVTRISDSTMTKIRTLIGHGVEEGWTLRQFADELAAKYDQFTLARSLLIATTEIGGAMNAGSMMGYRQSGVVAKKAWLTARDQIVRQSHYDAESVGAIELNESFPNGLDHPGDPTGPADEICNCRCTIKPVVEV